MSSVLYLTRNGLLEPLGQSQVMAYLRHLSRKYAITLITFEKPEDLADQSAMEAARADCAAHGIRWFPQSFRYRPRLAAPASSMLLMLRLALREARAGRAQLIHSRSYLPAGVALLVRRLTGVPFIFDMRALWPEEMITAGRLRRGSPVHRLLIAMERACLREAATVVSLTHAAVDHLRVAYPREIESQRILINPTCVDLDRFTLRASPAPEDTRVYGCHGTVLSGWFLTGWLAALFESLAQRDPSARFEVLTRDDPDQVRAALTPSPELAARLTIRSVRPQDMPETLRSHDLSAFLYAGGSVSELGRSPTRMAEALACGIPVIANSGVGDVARIIGEHRVGVLLEGPETKQLDAALDTLEALRADPNLPRRCREAARSVFSLEAGAARYAETYATILSERPTERRRS